MKINGEYPKFYINIEGKRYAAIDNDPMFCFTRDGNVACAFYYGIRSYCDPDLACIKNRCIYVEVPEE